MTTQSNATDRARTWRPAWALGGGLIACMAVLTAVSVWIRGLDVGSNPLLLDGSEALVDWAELGWRFDSVLFAASVVVASFILSGDREHRFGWVLLVAAGVVPVLAMTVVSGALLSISGVLPTSWAPWLAALLPAIGVGTVVGFMSAMALFPTGRPHAQNWSAGFKAFWGLAGVLAIGVTLAPGPSWALLSGTVWAFDNPLGVSALGWFDTLLIDVFYAVFAVFVVASVVSRYRAADTEVRHQLKWVMVAGVIVVVVSSLPIGGPTVNYVKTAAGFPMVLALGIAITRYRLFDIDVVISRSLVFVVLVGFITVVYAVLVVGVGSLVGGSTLGWQVGATALVAVVFEPVRERVQRWINRLVLGRRATPYEVLSDLTGRLAATEREEGLLDRMAVRLAEGTGADRAIVWVRDDAGFAAVACEPGELPTARVDDVGGLAGSVVPIRHDDELLGALSVESRRGDALTPTEQRLVEDLAGSAGLLMRRLRLDAELERKARELEESRRRLVDAQDVERRRLERELNEGAQQRVVALKVQLGLAGQQARSEGADMAAGLIGQMESETQDAIDQIRALANGIYPPLLEAEGLTAAITALAEVAPVEVVVSAGLSGRYPLPTEGAVYFCVSEALTNAIKHGVAPIQIEVSDTSGELAFTVADSGPGFDPDRVQRGSGLNNMADRLDALDGTVTITSQPGASTTITGHLPLPIVAGIT